MTKPQLLTVVQVGKPFLSLVTWDEEHWQEYQEYCLFYTTKLL